MQESNNPYAAPAAVVENDSVVQEGSFVLASRARRLVAYIVDALLHIAISLGIALPLGVIQSVLDGNEPDVLLLFGIFLASLFVFFVLNAYLIANYGQTIGKRLLAIRIARPDGTKAGFWQIVLRRYLIMDLLTQLPTVGGLIGLVDVLFIFAADRRCLHDQIAGTIVLEAN